jgi:hypothetical protein
MAVLDLTLAFRTTLRIFTISVWFSQVLPSIVGGDAVRIWLLQRAGIGWRPGGKAVVIDRIVALCAIVVLIGLTYPLFWGIADQTAARLTVAVLIAAGIAGTLTLAGLDLLPVAMRRIWLFARLASLAQGLRAMFSAGRRTFEVAVLAVVVHGLTVASIFVLARGAGASLSPLQALALVPPVILLSAVPVSIGSWGVREGAMVASLALAGIAAPTALAISIQLGLASVAVGLVGGALWLLGADRQAYVQARPKDETS